jgi:hypothetical protein
LAFLTLLRHPKLLPKMIQSGSTKKFPKNSPEGLIVRAIIERAGLPNPLLSRLL